MSYQYRAASKTTSYTGGNSKLLATFTILHSKNVKVGYVLRASNKRAYALSL